MKGIHVSAYLLAMVLSCWGGLVASGADWERDFLEAAKEIESIAGREHNERGFAAMKSIVNNAEVPARYRLKGLVHISRYLLKWKVKPPHMEKERVRALRYCARAEKLLAEVESAEIKLWTLLKLAECYGHRRAKKSERVLPCYDRARKVIPQIEQPGKRLSSWVDLAVGYKELGHFKKVPLCCTAAAELVEEIEPPRQKLPWLVRLAELSNAARDPAGTLEAAQAAHTLYVDAGDIEGQARCLLLTGRANERQDHLDWALDAYLRAAKLTNDWEAFTAASRCLIAAGKPDEAFKVLSTAVAKSPASAPGYLSTRGGAKKAKSFFDTMFQSAGKFAKEEKLADGRLLLRVATCFVGRRASCLDRVARAQEELVRALLLEGKKEEALAEAKRYFLFCGIQDIGRAVDLVGRTLKAADGDINRRVKAFLDFQRFGPAGKDNKTGTKDDLQNPLAKSVVKRPGEYELLDALTAGLPVTDHRGRGYAHLLEGNAAEALTEFRSAYAVAGRAKLTEAIYDVGTAIKALDGHTLRANRYLLFQKHGPVGKDGKPGTPDDLADPLKGIAFKLRPERQQSLEAEIKKCGQDYSGLRRKAHLLLSLGRAEEGLAVMREAYAICEIDADSLKTAIMDVAAAIKAVDGHVFRANQYLLYQKHGAQGKDGVKGTEDDLADPLAAGAAPEAGGATD